MPILTLLHDDSGEGPVGCFEQGSRCLAAGDSAQARCWLLRCLRQDPDHGAAWHLLGKLAAAAGHPDQALTFQRCSCALHPQLGWNWFAAGELFEQRGDWGQAADHLERAARWLAEETWLVVLARRARQRQQLEGEDLTRGLGPAAYRFWVRRLEPALPPATLPLGRQWWTSTAAGLRSLRPDGTLAPFPAGDPSAGAGSDDWLLLLSPDALLRPGALQCLERDAADDCCDLLYPDEDRLDPEGCRCDPWYKPDWVPESFWSTPWLETMSVWRLSWLRQHGLGLPPADPLGRWRWQLAALRHQPRIAHLPRVLVHRRQREAAAMEPGASDAEQQQRAAALLAFLRAEGESVEQVRPAGPVDGGEGFLLQWALPPVSPTVRIVIPSRDQPQLLQACLASLEATRGRITPSVVLLDHASVEATTAAAIRQWRQRLGQRLVVLRDDGPFHWSRLCNRGAAGSHDDLLLFLNDDVEALVPGWLEALAAQSLRPAVGAVGGVLLYPDGSLQHAGMVLGFGGDGLGRPEHAYRGLAPDNAVHRGRSRRLSGWAAVTGACLMVRRGLFEAAGGFDDRFPVEGNDVDFCLRLGAMGYRQVIEPTARLLHRECQSRDPRASATARPALEALHRRHPTAMATAGRWWPAACSAVHTDGRPRELSDFL